MLTRRNPPSAGRLITFLLSSLLLSTTVTARPIFFLLSHDLPINVSSDDHDQFVESAATSLEELDPGSWRPIFEPNESDSDAEVNINPQLAEYYSAVRKLVGAVSDGGRAMKDVASEIESIAVAGNGGNPHAQSLLGFLYNMGMGMERNGTKAFVYHQIASDSGNMQSKLARTYTYYRQELYDKAVVLYAELAEASVNSFLISKDYPAIEPVRIHNRAEENKDALMKSRGEEDEDFRMLEHQADTVPIKVYSRRNKSRVGAAEADQELNWIFGSQWNPLEIGGKTD